MTDGRSKEGPRSYISGICRLPKKEIAGVVI